ncbi:unnamed protein product (macronuclear) [Paramecium tetraurelia]|uniref:Uncharacterized protein n=1 Tax=Paramecium tetraurelia TaxID=5888 RepID=A0C9B0_PARTE|nr:uncharacterized protein GSPATT00006683001 [Paramecium tetraurelia]CAK67377.1 unnamed protein product [Paramecium tetraurelia]|eukprot:XP_001434774.1 hypothetical protein (macronuclear) [Paramecium tetraurelia strain d4-2]
MESLQKNINIVKCTKLYHFYQEIWSFLLNYDYVSLSISVTDITQYNYIVQFKVYLLEKSFKEQERLINQIKKVDQNEKDLKREKLKQKLVHQYAKESFIILFEILNLKVPIRASLKPNQDTQALDQFLVQKFRNLEFYEYTYLSKNLLIPNNLNNNQGNVTRDKINQIKKQVKPDDEDSQIQIEQEENNGNLFSVNEQQSYLFTQCQQPEDLRNNLFDYQSQAVQWMLYREQRISAQTLNLQGQKQSLNKMWSQIQLDDDIYIYFNELTGQFSEKAVPSKDVKGGILADAMGLGKTICSIALILLGREMKQQQLNDINSEPLGKKVKLDKEAGNTLLVVELSVFEHWIEEIERHTKLNKLEVYQYYKPQSRVKEIKLEVYDIVITTYGVLKKDFTKNGLLYMYEWERIILDEAHVIKSKSTACAKAASSIQAKSRWCLTGTPIQNHLEDLFSLFHFLQVETFSDYYWFNHYINKQQDKAAKFNLLHEILRPLLLRRTKQSESIQSSLNLPSKQHFIVRVKMSNQEKKFYNTLYFNTQKYLKEFFGIGQQQKTKKIGYMHVFQLLSSLRQCCDHVGLIANKLKNKALQQQQQQQSTNKQKSELVIKQFIENAQYNLERSLKAQIQSLQQKQEQAEAQQQELEDDDDFSVQDEFSENSSTADEVKPQLDLKEIENDLKLKIQQLDKIQIESQDFENTQRKYESIFEKVKNYDCAICLEPLKEKSIIYYLSCEHIFCSCLESLPKQNETIVCPICRQEIENKDKIKLIQTKPAPSPQDDWYKESTKINEVLKYIEYVWKKNEKVVIFTQWISIMNFIEGKLRVKGIEFRKIQGKMDKNQRKASIKDFFEKQITVMLISLKAGAYGINLSCANHVLLVDPWWNPAVEDQAVERVHRLGQQKQVQIVSFICDNTIEERVLQMHKMKRQLFKDALQLKLPNQEFSFQDQIEFVMNQQMES